MAKFILFFAATAFVGTAAFFGVITPEGLDISMINASNAALIAGAPLLGAFLGGIAWAYKGR